MPPKRQILIAEDDLTFSQVLQAFLQEEGYEVDMVPDGRAALDRMTTTLPDLLITDLVMPGLTGWSVFTRTRAIAPWLPVIVISGTDVRRLPETPSPGEPTVVLRKPLDLDALLAAVTRLLPG